MKLLTHRFVIYDSGWRFEWEEKPPQTPAGILVFIAQLVWVGLVFSPMFGGRV